MDRLETLHGRVARVAVIKQNDTPGLLLINFRIIVNGEEETHPLVIGNLPSHTRKRSILATFICSDDATINFVRGLGEEKFDVQILRVCDDGPEVRGEVLGCTVLLPEKVSCGKQMTLVADHLSPHDTEEFFDRIDPAGKEERRKSLAAQKAVNTRLREQFARMEKESDVV